MIDEKVRAVFERQLESDETLIWLTKSKGVLLNRLALISLILLLLIAYFVQLNMSVEIPFYAKAILFFIVIYNVIAVFSPPFSYHILTDKRIMETTNIPLIAIKMEIYLSVNTHIGRAKWFGKNSIYVKHSEVTRINLGKYRIPVAAGISGIVLHGVVEPDKFEDMYNNPPI
ncbi:MAG: hypothetical protein ABJ275_08010 [Maricaulaceae bacterium]